MKVKQIQKMSEGKDKTCKHAKWGTVSNYLSDPTFYNYITINKTK